MSGPPDTVAPVTREALRARGIAMRTALFGATAAPAVPEGFDDLVLETTYGSIWSRPGLGLPDRMICTLAALCAVQQLAALRRYAAAALRLGLPPAAAFTLCTQIGIYNGFAATEAAFAALAEVYGGHGVAIPPLESGEGSLAALDHRGRELMGMLHGERGTKGYAAPDNPLTSRLYPLTIPYGYGEIWHRPGLELRQRALVSLAGFTALQMPDQLRKFGPSAMNLGLTLDEVCEAIIQTAPYSGYAPALNALRWLSEVA